MARLHRAWVLGGVLGLPLALGGCGALVVGGLAVAAGGGYVAAQERGADGAATDFAVKTDIAKAFTAADPRLQTGITTTLYQGRVLLTGRVEAPELKAQAVQIAGRTHDVRAVYDEIELAAPEGVWDGAQDAWISTRVRAEMVGDAAIRSVNYTVDTENGSVFLIGSARSQDELDRATRIARYVPGVKRVVSYVELRSGAPVAAGSMPPPMAAPSPGQPTAAPRTPVEVQKL